MLIVGDDGHVARARAIMDDGGGVVGWRDQQLGCMGVAWRADLVALLALDSGDTVSPAGLELFFGVAEGRLTWANGRRRADDTRAFVGELPTGGDNRWLAEMTETCRSPAW